jgi:hypothetical protein
MAATITWPAAVPAGLAIVSVRVAAGAPAAAEPMKTI